MKLVLITPGAGHMYCGNCLRDSALARALQAAGHDATLLPLYTPLTVDGPDVSAPRVFYGGLNVLLQDKLALFRQSLPLVDRLLDNPWLLRALARCAVKTRPASLGALTLSVLQGAEGHQRKELEKLISFLASRPLPDGIVLSNALLLGMARRLKEALRIPVWCTLSGEDHFIDGLPSPWREQVWQALRARTGGVDAFLPVSEYYRRQMQERLSLPAEKLHVFYRGIDPAAFQTPVVAQDRPPVIGYLGRLAPEKGLLTLVQAFVRLRLQPLFGAVKLHVAGRAAPQDRAYLKEVKAEIRKNGLERSVRFVDCPDQATKVAFLAGLTVLGIAAPQPEAAGLTVLEALACGVPVVAPAQGAFPELLRDTGGGLLVAPNDPAALAAGLARALTSPQEYARWRRNGQHAVRLHFSAACSARELVRICQLYLVERDKTAVRLLDC